MAFTLSGDVATTRTNLGLGDAATKTTGTAAGNVPVLDGSGKMPAVSGENLTSLPTQLPSGGSTGQVLTKGTTNSWSDAPGGAILKVHYIEDGTRRVIGSLGSGINLLADVGTISKVLATTSLSITMALAARVAYHGDGVYWIRAKTPSTTYSWRRIALHGGSHTQGLSLGGVSLLAASDCAVAGTINIELGYRQN